MVAELKHGKLPKLEAELESLEQADRKDDAILKEEVTAEEIAEIVARWTGVPVTKLIEGERENYFVYKIFCMKGSSDKMKRSMQ